MANEQINLNIHEGEPFFGHEVTVNFTPTQLTMDFKCITPRSDPRFQGKPSFQIKHNVVMLDPWHAKAMMDVLGTALQKYETEFGEIEKPSALLKAEEKQKEKLEAAQSAASTNTTPNYLG